MKTDILNKELAEKIKKDKTVIAVILFGSYTKGKGHRDIDICLVLDHKYDNLFLSKKRLEYLSIAKSKFDIQIFQQLPLYVKIRILKGGKVILCKKEELLYDIAFATIKEFAHFKDKYYDYIGVSKLAA